MADIFKTDEGGAIPVEGKSIFDPQAGRKIRVEKAVQTANDIGGAQAVYEVVDTNLRQLRSQLAVEAGKKDRATTTVKTQTTEKPWKWFWQK